MIWWILGGIYLISIIILIVEIIRAPEMDDHIWARVLQVVRLFFIWKERKNEIFRFIFWDRRF